MCPHCLPTIRTLRCIPHHSWLKTRTSPGLSADNTHTICRNGIIHFGNASCSCPCSSGRQALLGMWLLTLAGINVIPSYHFDLTNMTWWYFRRMLFLLGWVGYKAASFITAICAVCQAPTIQNPRVSWAHLLSNTTFQYNAFAYRETPVYQGTLSFQLH